MTRWQYLSVSARVETFSGNGAVDRWRYSVSDPWTATYEALITASTGSGTDRPLLGALGEDGWELVTSIDLCREQVSVESAGYVHVFDTVVERGLTFKRQLDESTALLTANAEALEAERVHRLQEDARAEAAAAAVAPAEVASMVAPAIELDPVEEHHYRSGDDLYCRTHRLIGCTTCPAPPGHHLVDGRWSATRA